MEVEGFTSIKSLSKSLRIRVPTSWWKAPLINITRQWRITSKSHKSNLLHPREAFGRGKGPSWSSTYSWLLFVFSRTVLARKCPVMLCTLNFNEAGYINGSRLILSNPSNHHLMVPEEASIGINRIQLSSYLWVTASARRVWICDRNRHWRRASIKSQASATTSGDGRSVGFWHVEVEAVWIRILSAYYSTENSNIEPLELGSTSITGFIPWSRLLLWPPSLAWNGGGRLH